MTVGTNLAGSECYKLQLSMLMMLNRGEPNTRKHVGASGILSRSCWCPCILPSPGRAVSCVTEPLQFQQMTMWNSSGRVVGRGHAASDGEKFARGTAAAAEAGGGMIRVTCDSWRWSSW